MDDSSDEFCGFEGGSSNQSNEDENFEENADENVDDENNEENIDDENDDNNDNKARKTRAPVWVHFEEFTNENGETFARCKHHPCTA